jgi:acetyltransferase-like isoleucine patch superfamily enzyme
MQAFIQGKDCKVYPSAVIFSNVILGNNVTIFPGAVIGRPPLSSGATLIPIETNPLASVRIGDNCVIGANSVIYADVEIGNNTMICDTACIREECRIGSYSVIAMGVTINRAAKMGNRVKIMDNSHITTNAIIKDDVFISTGVTLSNDNAMGRKPIPKGGFIGPTIRRFATIGQGACILPGIEIGENAVIGANSVVTKNVPPRSVVMGVPATFKRWLKPDEILSDQNNK